MEFKENNALQLEINFLDGSLNLEGRIKAENERKDKMIHKLKEEKH